MRLKLLMIVAGVMTLANCQGREQANVTGSYGSSVLAGRVAMADGSSPAGVTVTVRGSGLRALLQDDGAFAFAGAPQDAQLDFARAADGVAASLRVASGSGSINIELTKTAAHSSKRRGAGSGSGVQAIEIEGVVRSASATRLVVLSAKGVEETIAIAADTVVRKGNTTIGVADLVAGMRVHVKAKKVDNGLSALVVIVQNDGGEDDGDDDGKGGGTKAEAHLSGTVTAVSASSITIKAGAATVTVQTDASTRIQKHRAAATLADIHTGDRVKVEGKRVAENTVLATEIEVK
jgi:hypothetical protein